MVKKQKTVKLSEKGKRIGEDHQRALLNDKQVEQIREYYEEGLYGYTAIALHFTELFGFEVKKSSVAMICRYERRNTTFANSKTVHITDEDA